MNISTQTSEAPLLLIDGDVLCYLACTAEMSNFKEVRGNTAYVRLDENGKRIPQPHTPETSRKQLELAYKMFKKNLQNLLDTLFCDEFLMAVKAPGKNYRDLLYPDYKANRRIDPAAANSVVPALRQLAVMEDLAIPAVNREADDLLRIWAKEAEAIGRPYIVASIDKDLYCIPGSHYHLKKKEMIEITPEKAMRLYYEQMLKGDPTDNIPGIPGIGPKKAEAFLKNCITEEDFQEVVVEQYIEAFGDDWRSYLLSNAKMIHLQTHWHDYFSFDNWSVVRSIE